MPNQLGKELRGLVEQYLDRLVIRLVERCPQQFRLVPVTVQAFPQRGVRKRANHRFGAGRLQKSAYLRHQGIRGQRQPRRLSGQLRIDHPQVTTLHVVVKLCSPLGSVEIDDPFHIFQVLCSNDAAELSA